MGSHSRKGTVNSLLRQERQRLLWRQKDLADYLGTTTNNVSRWEPGVTQPGPYFRTRLCELFGKSADALGLAPASLQTATVEEAVFSPEEKPLPVSEPVERTWSIPFPRNPFFTGRQAILEQIDTLLSSQQAAQTIQAIALSGLAGIGKTQLAVEYAYRSQDRYRTLLWAKADTREVLLADIAGLCRILGLLEQGEQDQRRMIEVARRWLAEQTDWLLILDNVEDLSVVSEVLPPTPRGHFLLTMRGQVTGTLARRIDLEQMELEEGALLLLRRAKRIAPQAIFDEVSPSEQAAALQITQELGALPLALDQAGAYIEETGCSLAAYHTHYQKRRASLLRLRGESITDHPTSVTATLFLCIEKVAQANAAALDTSA